MPNAETKLLHQAFTEVNANTSNAEHIWFARDQIFHVQWVRESGGTNLPNVFVREPVSLELKITEIETDNWDISQP